MTATEPTGVERIAAERQEQITRGYTPDHDFDHHHPEELVQAARAYLLIEQQAHLAYGLWPFNPGSFRPGSDRRDELAKAGALIAAAIDAYDEEARRHG